MFDNMDDNTRQLLIKMGLIRGDEVEVPKPEKSYNFRGGEATAGGMAGGHIGSMVGGPVGGVIGSTAGRALGGLLGGDEEKYDFGTRYNRVLPQSEEGAEKYKYLKEQENPWLPQAWRSNFEERWGKGNPGEGIIERILYRNADRAGEKPNRAYMRTANRASFYEDAGMKNMANLAKMRRDNLANTAKYWNTYYPGKVVKEGLPNGPRQLIKRLMDYFK